LNNYSSFFTGNGEEMKENNSNHEMRVNCSPKNSRSEQLSRKRLGIRPPPHEFGSSKEM
jgi:hypothetical protein